MRCGGARLHPACESRVERGDRQVNSGHPFRRHRRDQVDVAQDERRFGHDREGVLVQRQQFDDAAGDPPFALDRLVRIGVRSERDRIAAITRPREFGAQQLGRVGLGEDARFEVDARREVEIGVRWSRKAIDAAVLAALVGVDRLRERHVRRVVVRDDAARVFPDHLGGQGLPAGAHALRQRVPAVVGSFAGVGLEAMRHAARRAAPLERLQWDANFVHGVLLERLFVRTVPEFSPSVARLRQAPPPPRSHS